MAFVFRTQRRPEPRLGRADLEEEREQDLAPPKQRRQKVRQLKQRRHWRAKPNNFPDPCSYSLQSQFDNCRPSLGPPFLSSEQRLKIEVKEGPGPGHYLEPDSRLSNSNSSIGQTRRPKIEYCLPSARPQAQHSQLYLINDHESTWLDSQVGSKPQKRKAVAFVSKEHRFRNYSGQVPGPGSYFLEPPQPPRYRMVEVADRSRKVQQQGDSSQEQEYVPGAAPGPGTYNLTSQRSLMGYTIRKAVDKQVSSGSSPGPGHFVPNQIVQSKKTRAWQGFLSSNTRFHTVANQAPGPGTYLSEACSPTSTGKLLTFLSKRPRFSKEVLKVPDQLNSVEKSGSKGFALSKDERFRTAKDCTLGPGLYDPPSYNCKTGLSQKEVLVSQEHVAFGRHKETGKVQIYDFRFPKLDRFYNYYGSQTQSVEQERQVQQERRQCVGKELLPEAQLRPRWDKPTHNILFKQVGS